MRNHRTLGIMAAATALHLDANEARLFTRALEHVQAQLVETEFPGLVGADAFPVDGSVDPGADTFTWRLWTPVGIASLVANYSDDVQRATEFATENISRFGVYATVYGYSMNDVRRALFAKSKGADPQLDPKEGKSARMAIERRLDQAAFFGEPSIASMTGGINNPNVPLISTFITGNWDAPGTTGAQILADMRVIIHTVRTQSKAVHRADTLLVGTATLAAFSKEVNTFNNKTVYDLLLENKDLGIKEIIYSPKCDLADAQGNGERMVVYEKSVENVKQLISMPFNQYPPQPKGTGFDVFCECKTGGTVWEKPLAGVYVDGMHD